MKKYFVKKCQIKTRTKVSDNLTSFVPLDEEMIDVECLCMCMRDLKETDVYVGDRVWNELSGYGVVIENTLEEKFLGIKYDKQEFEVEEEFENIIKIIGRLSSKVFWVVEGNGFDETEISIQKICHDDSCPPYDSYCFHCSRSSKCGNDEGDKVLIKNPSCQHFH